MQLLVKHKGLKVSEVMLASRINCQDSVAPNKQMWVSCHLQKAVLHALKQSLPQEIIMGSSPTWRLKGKRRTKFPIPF